MLIKYGKNLQQLDFTNNNMAKKAFYTFSSVKNKNFDTVELSYSCLFWISDNQPWFCRIWHKDWLENIRRGKKEFGESYGKTKFEAYRKALADLKN